LELDYKTAQGIIDNNPKLSSSRNTFLTNMLGQAMDRIESFVLLSPEERYNKLIAEKPDITNRVPDKYLATMLGITPVSLSRIRKRIVSQHKR
jgi:DNA-directed RNA polymerase subunit F